MITVESLESLATELERDDAAQRARLLRLSIAYVRILAQREGYRFCRQPCHYGDEAGSWDRSYPPTLVYSERNGPCLLEIADCDTEDVATGRGFYFPWRRVTTYQGLWISRDGAWYRCEKSGTGRVGQFAAYPGDCDVDVEISWSVVPVSALSTAELGVAELRLRDLAFPLIAAARSRATE